MNTEVSNTQARINLIIGEATKPGARLYLSYQGEKLKGRNYDALISNLRNGKKVEESLNSLEELFLIILEIDNCMNRREKERPMIYESLITNVQYCMDQIEDDIDRFSHPKNYLPY